MVFCCDVKAETKMSLSIVRVISKLLFAALLCAWPYSPVVVEVDVLGVVDVVVDSARNGFSLRCKGRDRNKFIY